MDIRTRTLKAIGHVQPDRVPYDIRFTQQAHARMVDYYGDPDFADTLGNCFTWFRPYPGDLRFMDLGNDIFEDEFGVRWNRSIDKDIGVPCRRLITPENLDAFPWPDPRDPRRYDFIAEAIPQAGDTVVLVSLGFALFERAWTLTGMENLLIAMLADKPFVHALLDRIMDYNLGIIDKACELDIDIVRFGDDWGHQRGLIMGLELWREFIRPRIQLMYDRVRARGKTVMIHCCGKVDELFEDLIDCGLDIFNPFQPEVMDVGDMKRRYGNRLCFYGGISTQQTLPYGSVADVRDEVRRLIDTIGEGGGFIASPAHDIPHDAKPENIAAMIEVLQEQ
jgi:uroporphyrinogen decarboxylase